MSQITDRDKLIIQHIDKYRFITIKQTMEMFMNPTASKGYIVAARRLKAIQDSNHLFGPKGERLKNTIHPFTGEMVYHYGKVPTFHDLQIFNLYARLMYIGIEIDFFKVPAIWMHGKYRSDAFFSYNINGKKRVAFLEVCHTNNDTHIKGYEELFISGELQDKLVGVFPDIILLGHRGRIPDTNLKVITVKEDLSDIYNLFI